MLRGLGRKSFAKHSNCSRIACIHLPVAYSPITTITMAAQSAAQSSTSTNRHSPKSVNHARHKYPLLHTSSYSSRTSCTFCLQLSQTTPIQLSTLLPLQSASFLFIYLFIYLFFICCKCDKYKLSIKAVISPISPSSSMIISFAGSTPSHY